MKTIFIATLGTREIQFKIEDLLNNGFVIDENNRSIEKNGILVATYKNENYPDFLCHAFPREAGETILNNYEMFAPVLCFPLIEKALQQIRTKQAIDEFYLVYTDQQAIDKNSPQHRKDTVYYKDIIQRYIQEQTQCSPAQLHDIAITEEAVNYDFQYLQFAKHCRKLFEDAQYIEHIYLLAQGGIDQINHALTLQLIQAFGNKVHLWQQSENRTEANELQFPHLFLKDLLKQQLMALVEEAEYFSALKLLEHQNIDKTIIKILNFAYFRKEFIITKAKNVCNNFGSNAPILIKNFNSNELEINENFKKCFDFEKPKIKKALFNCLERFYLADFYFSKKNYSKFVLSFSIFYENLIITYLSSVTGLMILDKYDKYGNELIKNICNNRPEYKEFLIRTLNRKKSDYAIVTDLKLSFPVLILIAHLYSAEFVHHSITSLISILEHSNFLLNDNKDGQKALDQLRNSIAHDGIGCEEADLIKASDEAIDISWWENKMQEIKNIIGINENPFEQINTLLMDWIKKM